MNFGMRLGVLISLSNTEAQCYKFTSLFPSPLLWQILVGLRTQQGRKLMNIHILLILSIVSVEQIKESMNCDISLTKDFLVT